MKMEFFAVFRPQLISHDLFSSSFHFPSLLHLFLSVHTVKRESRAERMKGPRPPFALPSFTLFTAKLTYSAL